MKIPNSFIEFCNRNKIPILINFQSNSPLLSSQTCFLFNIDRVDHLIASKKIFFSIFLKAHGLFNSEILEIFENLKNSIKFSEFLNLKFYPFELKITGVFLESLLPESRGTL